MTNADAAAAMPAQGAPRWPRLLLLVAAAIELLGGLSDLPILLGNLSEIPGPGLGGAIIIAKIALQPLLALAALIFTLRGRLPYALLAMAFIILMTWLNYLPSVATHGLELQGSPAVVLLLVFQIIVAPLLALAIAGLVLTGKQLTLATLLAVLPTLISILSVIAFGIGVAIYGF
jgi:hypothetical protein